MKKLLNLWLMVALVCGLAVSVTSCKDDDKNDNGNQSGGQTEEQSDKDMADAADFWGVVGQLSDTPMPDNWRNATYQPSIGVPDGTNSAVRIVSCTDEESAAARAADLLGGNITTETSEYTYENPVVGTMTYRKTGGASLATVDVSIKQMPGLSQIIYKTPEQMGENASFSGTAYYRFGDVVEKTDKNGHTDFWICIRPSFGPAGKGESHWISVSPLPEENLNKQEKGALTHKLPKGLCNTQEYLVDLAEVLYAMTDAKQWSINLIKDDGYKKLKYLWDFDFKQRYEYHDLAYFDKLGEEWEKINLFQTIFGLTREEMRQHLSTKGLSMIYNQGTISGNDITLKVVRYDGMNLKTKHEFKTTGRWDTKAFDINALIGDKGYIDDNRVVTGVGDRYWVVRYASGATLAKGDEPGGYNQYKKMPNCRDFFLYNQLVEKYKSLTADALKNTPPRSSLDGVFEERSYYSIGDVLLDKTGNRWICVQIPPYEMDKDRFPGMNFDYAYFISYDRAAVGDQLRNVPKRELAMQMLFSLEILYHDVSMSWYSTGSPNTTARDNIKRYADVDLNEIIALRDTVHVFRNIAPGEVINSYASTVFKNTSGRLSVLRLVADYTAEDDELGRMWTWHFYDTYSKDLRTQMLLSDLSDQNKVNAFNQDVWVRLPWVDVLQQRLSAVTTATTGPRTDTENLADLNRLIYQRGRSFLNANEQGELVPFDMYRDPLVPFAVKRLKDTKKPLEKFEDGTAFCNWSRAYNLDRDVFGSIYNKGTICYDRYVGYRRCRTLNEQVYDWGMTNATK